MRVRLEALPDSSLGSVTRRKSQIGHVIVLVEVPSSMELKIGKG